jgi:flagellar biosynthetic protein FliR
MTLPALDPVVFLLVLARIAGLVLAAPLFGHVALPVRVRVGLAVAFAIALAPGVPALPGGPPASLFTLAGLIAVESALGVMIGLAAQLVFAGIQLGGQIAGIQMGFGMASLVDPQTHAQETVVAHWQQLVALLVFLVLDGHHLLLRALIASFHAAPPGAVALAGDGFRALVSLAGGLFELGVRVAAPVTLAILLTNAALGVLARMVPQLNVFVVGFPVNVGVGLMVIGAALPFTLRLFGERFGELEPVLGRLVWGVTHG